MSPTMSKSSLNYKALIKPYLKNWKWFVICVIIAVTLGYLKIRYEAPQYAIKSKIQIIDDQTSNSELAAFKDLQFLSTGGGGEISDEIEILSSRTNIIDIVKKLELNKRIIELGNIRDTETYLNSPINVNFLASDSIINTTDVEFYISLKSNTSFEYSLDEDGPLDIYPYGKTFNTPAGDIVVTPNFTNFSNLKDRKYRVSVKPLAMVAEIYQKQIQILVADQLSSNIITISLEDPIKQKGKDILNMLVANYNENAIQDKKAIADRTSNFINDRIADIYGDLSTVDQSAEDFKAGRGIADISTQTSVNLNIGATSQQELQNASVQLDIASSMKDIIDSQSGYELLPANVGLADPTIAGATARYNDLALERKRLLESSNEKNPIIVNLDQQLDGLKRSMKSSLNSVTNNLALQVNSLSNQLSKINSRIYSAPRNERALRDITRQQQTTESLYLYLLQKREEAQITFASASPKSKIIDDAYLESELPVSPKKPLVLLASLILGLLFPFSVIYAKNMLDNKIQNKIGLERLVGNIPVLAELPKIPKKDNLLIKTNERTVLAESLRILRTNLDYVLKSKKKSTDFGGNTIFVTSSVSGEGKTLVASNLAMIYANTNKKVLLLGADIRNPKINQFYSDKSKSSSGKTSVSQGPGLTDFLADHKVELKDIISSISNHNQVIDVIYSGRIPPNPTELLMNERMDDLISFVKKRYDYIIVDTAPVMVVSDTLLISKYADQTLYITRAGMTERDVMEFPLKLNKEGKLKNLSFIVNGVHETDLGYGGKYGYGYGKSVKKWWKFA